MLQESKLHGISDRGVAEIWGRRYVNGVAVDAVGAARGLLLMWDTRSVPVLNSWQGAFSLSVLVEDQTNNSKWLLTSVKCWIRLGGGGTVLGASVEIGML